MLDTTQIDTRAMPDYSTDISPFEVLMYELSPLNLCPVDMSRRLNTVYCPRPRSSGMKKHSRADDEVVYLIKAVGI